MMSIAWPADLVSAIARRRAVILIGSGVSANAQAADGTKPPTWGDFLSHANIALGRRVKHINDALQRFNYLEACAYLKREHGNNWNNLIRSSFVTPQYKAASIHKAIFDLDSRIVASLNFDKIYENYAIPASDGTVIVKNYHDTDVRQAIAGPDRYVVKPHGSVDALSKMIFTLEDYAKARVEHASFYEMITSLLHTHTFLCIGCGLSDPDFKIIFEDYRYKYGEAPHYMTLPKPFSDQELSLVKDTRGINVLTYNSKDNHKELTENLVNLVKLVVEERSELVKNQNW